MQHGSLFGGPVQFQSEDGSEHDEDEEDGQGPVFSPDHSVTEATGDDMPTDGAPPPVQPTNAPPPHQSDFAAAFPNIVPAPPVVRLSPSANNRRVSESLIAYWDENVPVQLKTFNITNEKVFKGVCLSPTKEQCGKMYARSKCTKLLHPTDNSLLSLPIQTLSYCFMQKSGPEIPLHIQNVLFFFNSVNLHASVDITHYAAPTDTASVVNDRSDSKIIRGLSSTGEGLTHTDVAPSHAGASDDFINVNDILMDRSADQAAEIKMPIAPITMFIGFVGAVAMVDGAEVREVYCVCTIVPASNFAMWPYITENFLKRPKQGCQKYDELIELFTEASAFYKLLMRYEIYHNLGVKEDLFRPPEDYQTAVGGALSPATVLSPFQLPLKIFTNMRKNLPGIDPTTIRIIGMPEMTFRSDDETTCDWIRMMHSSINAVQRRDATFMEGLRRYDCAKEKEAFPPIKLSSAAGWPLEVDDEFNVTCFGLPPLPLMHIVDTHGARGSFPIFMASFGLGDEGVPRVTRAYLTAFLVNSSAVDQRPDIAHLLKDDAPANPLECLRKYFGKGSDPFSALIIANRHRSWFDAVFSDIALRRSKGASIQEAVTVIMDYLKCTLQTLDSMVESQVFRSNTVIQMQMIQKQLDFDLACKTGKDSIRELMRARRSKASCLRAYDPFYGAWDLFMKMWEDMNEFFFLNAGNLVCAIEVLLAQFMFKFAPNTNKTWTFFYVTVLVMSGNGHFMTHTQDGPVPDRKKPNTTGMDFTLARLCEIWNALYDKLLVQKKDRHHLFMNCMRFTPTVWENMVCASAVGGRIVTVPPPDSNFQVMSITEMREDTLKSVIQWGANRNDETGATVSLNSAENKDKSRSALVKQKLTSNALVVISTNKGSDDKKHAEEGRTLDVVCAIIPPGAGPPESKKRKAGDFANSNNGGTNARHQPLGNKDAVLNCIAYTQNFAGYFVALINHIGGMTVECNKTSEADYGWLCQYLFQYGFGCFETSALEGWSRMKEGYKSRGVVLSIWLKCIAAMAMGKSEEETIKYVWMDIHMDAMPIVSIPATVCNIGYRAFNMGALLMVNVIAQELSVPVIEWKSLRRFFMSTVAPLANDPDVAYREDFAMIRGFVELCLDQNRFCPNDDTVYDPDENISCYITADADSQMIPTNKNSILRVSLGRDTKLEEDISYKLGKRILTKYGKILFSQCHMGAGGDSSSYMYALQQLTDRFSPDFRGLLDNMFSSRDLFHMMGLLSRANGMQNHDDASAPMMAKRVSFKSGGDIKSQAIGVNIWSMLAVVSLGGGTEIHPHVSNHFTNGLVQEILAFSPPGTTPGGICPIRCFDPHSTKSVKLHIRKDGRPNHFPRPTTLSFMYNGALPLAQTIENFLPEDLLANPSISDIAENDLKCTLMEVPGNAYTTTPNLMPDEFYTFHIPHFSKNEYGTVHVISVGRAVEITWYNNDQTLKHAETSDYDEWDQYMRDNHMVVTPLITRGGACVQATMEDVDDAGETVMRKVLGCLIPYPETGRLLNPDLCTYQALISESLDTVEVFFMDVLKDYLIRVGEEMLLDPTILDNEAFSAQGRGGKLLYTRLFVPDVISPVPGKLYVMALHQPVNRRGRPGAGATPMVFAVNPWNLQLKSDYTGDPKLILKHLV